MKVMLKQDVEKLGRKGDIVSVKTGFGRNYLIPRKLAVAVTQQNIKMIEVEQQALKKKREKEKLVSSELIEKLNQVTLTFARRASEKDVIFGSVTSADIKDELDKRGIEIDRKKIILDEPIKRLGTFTVPVKVYHEERASVTVIVTREADDKNPLSPETLSEDETGKV